MLGCVQELKRRVCAIVFSNVDRMVKLMACSLPVMRNLKLSEQSICSGSADIVVMPNPILCVTEISMCCSVEPRAIQGLGQVLSDLLRGCGPELREFVLYAWGTEVTEDDNLAISTHCTNLSSLAIHSNRVESPVAPIWRSIGSRLTRVNIGNYYRYSDVGYGFHGITLRERVSCSRGRAE